MFLLRKLYSLSFPLKKHRLKTQHSSSFYPKVELYVEVYLYISSLRSIGLHGGQHSKIYFYHVFIRSRVKDVSQEI